MPAAGASTDQTVSLYWLAVNGLIAAPRSYVATFVPKKSRGLAETNTWNPSSSFTSVRSAPELMPKVVTPWGSSRKPTTSVAKFKVSAPLPGMPGNAAGTKLAVMFPSTSSRSNAAASFSKSTVSTA